jgi:tRNA(Ile)-lysidine synthase
MPMNIRNIIEKYDMFSCSGDYQSPVNIIVALSGGADSVCLIHVLRDLNVAIEACHINHMLRGEASERDEEFVRELCSRLGVRLHVRRIDVKSLQKKHQSIEECAREVRYSYFFEIGKDSLIATAHTANDNAETILLNMTRGTGLKGLCGIPPKRGNIIRPLIETTRAEIIAYLKEKNVGYVTDETNYSDEFTRNNLRLNIIPLLEKINPSFTESITRMSRILREDDEFMSKIAVSCLEEAHEKNNFYKTDELLKQPPPILNRIISIILSQNNISPSNLRINNIVSLLETGGKINLAKDKFAIVRGNLLHIEKIHQIYRKN